MLERFGTRLLEALFGSIIALMGVSMAVNFFRSGVPAKEVALGEQASLFSKDVHQISCA